MVANLFFTGNANLLPGETTEYAALICIYDGTRNQIGVCTFDEDFNIITVPDFFLAFGSALPNTHRQFGSLTRFNDKWYVGSCLRRNPQSDSTIYFFEVTDIYNSLIDNVIVVQDKSIANSWCALTLEYVNFIVRDNQLYLFLSGEASGGDHTVGGPSTGNRLHAMYWYNGTSFELCKTGPYICNCVNSEHVYADLGSLGDMYDHMGGTLSFITDNTGSYMMCIVRGGTYLAYVFKLNE
jgi:hypothetical protein